LLPRVVANGIGAKELIEIRETMIAIAEVVETRQNPEAGGGVQIMQYGRESAMPQESEREFVHTHVECP